MRGFVTRSAEVIVCGGPHEGVHEGVREARCGGPVSGSARPCAAVGRSGEAGCAVGVGDGRRPRQEARGARPPPRASRVIRSRTGAGRDSQLPGPVSARGPCVVRRRGGDWRSGRSPTRLFRQPVRELRARALRGRDGVSPNARRVSGAPAAGPGRQALLSESAAAPPDGPAASRAGCARSSAQSGGSEGRAGPGVPSEGPCALAPL